MVKLHWYQEQPAKTRNARVSWEPASTAGGKPWIQSVHRGSVICVFDSEEALFNKKLQLEQCALDSIEASLGDYRYLDSQGE